MLVRLYGTNFRSLKDRFELSMVAADLKRSEDRDRGIIQVPIAGLAEPLRLLRVAALFGPNASGKSNVLTAANALNWLVTQSSARSMPEATILPYEPFRLDQRSSQSPIELGCDVTYKDKLIRYEITFESKGIRRELLAVLDGNGQEVLIDREPTGKTGGRLIEKSSANRLYVEGMQPNVTVLSKLGQHGPQKGKESVQPFYQAIRSATIIEDYSDATLEKLVLGPSNAKLADDPHYREWVMDHLMRVADFGICDMSTRRESSTLPKEIRDRIEKDSGKFQFPDSHVVVSFIHEGDVNQPFDFSDESAGTRKVFNIANDWWMLAHQSITLFADELGASLHPRLLDRLVRAVNDAPAETMRSQLIFATHDAGLLEGQDGQPPALRRDQVYLTRKDTNGATDLYALAEFKEEARPVHNIRKRYLSGLYGAIPLVEKLSL